MYFSTVNDGFLSFFCERLENPDSDEVKEFVEKQVDLTESLLRKCETREDLRRKITAMFDHARYDTPFKRGDRYFYFHNTGLQAQSVLYMQVVIWRFGCFWDFSCLYNDWWKMFFFFFLMVDCLGFMLGWFGGEGGGFAGSERIE